MSSFWEKSVREYYEEERLKFLIKMALLNRTPPPVKIRGIEIRHKGYDCEVILYGTQPETKRLSS